MLHFSIKPVNIIQNNRLFYADFSDFFTFPQSYPQIVDNPVENFLTNPSYPFIYPIFDCA